MENRPIKILFVDDDITFGAAIAEGLIFLGYNVYFQSSLIAIETTIQEFQPNIIILDVEIGDKDGIDDSIKFRELFPKIPIIFVSSHVDPSYIKRALKNGGATYLKKPIEIDELAAYIDKYAITEFCSSIAIGHFTINLNSRLLTNTETNHCHKLNKKEFELLCMLAENIEVATDRGKIIEKIWGGDYSNSQVLNNYIGKVRKYLSSDASIQIETIPREGYRMTVK